MKKIGLLVVMTGMVGVAHAGVIDYRGGVTSFPDPIMDLDPGTSAPETRTATEESVDVTVTILSSSDGYVAGDSDKPWGNDSLEGLFNVAQAGATNLQGPRHALAGNRKVDLELTFSSTAKPTYLFLMDVDKLDNAADTWVLTTDGIGGVTFLSASRFLGTADNEDGKAPLDTGFGAQYDELTGILTGTLDATNEYVSVFDITGLDTLYLAGNGGTQFAVGVVPEPATMALLGFGGMALLRRRK